MVAKCSPGSHPWHEAMETALGVVRETERFLADDALDASDTNVRRALTVAFRDSLKEIRERVAGFLQAWEGYV